MFGMRKGSEIKNVRQDVSELKLVVQYFMVCK